MTIPRITRHEVETASITEYQKELPGALDHIDRKANQKYFFID